MAESIVRLRVESQEFESKLKRASQELLAMADNARRTGATFAIADKEELAFVSSLGQLQTSARSAKGSIAEMTKAFQALSMHYRDLTAEEKASPYGQALEKSLQQLQDRINESKKSLGEINSSIGESKSETDLLSGAVNELTGKLGINIPKLGAMSIAIAAVTGAAKVAKDAFFANEQQLDEWGRMTESCTSLYNGFLDALNTGDISGYLQRIKQIVDAARSAYDALDELGTYNAFNQVNVSRDKQRLTNAMADYREGKGSKEEVRAASQAVLRNLDEKYNKQNDAYVAMANKLAAQYGVSAKDLMRIANGSYADFKKAQSVQMTGTEYKVHTTPSGFQYTTTQKVAANAAEALGAALRRINDTVWEKFQKLGADREETRNESGQVRRQVSRMLGQSQLSDTTTSKPSTVRVSPQNTQVIDTEKFAFRIDERFDGGMLQDEINGKITEKVTEALSEVIKNDLKNVDPEKLKVMLQGNDTQNVFKGADLRQVKKEDKKDTADLSKLNKAVGAIANITGALQNMGIKLPENLTKAITIMQSLCTIIQSVQTIISLFSTSTATAQIAATTMNTVAIGSLEAAVWANVGTNFIPFLQSGGVAGQSFSMKKFAGGGIAKGNSITSTIIQHFAQGGLVQNIHHHAANGFVGGNNYSGDLIPIAVNSGELILNKAQQGNLASQLSDVGLGGLTLSTRLHAKDIEFVLDRNLRDTSRGKYVTTKRNG